VSTPTDGATRGAGSWHGMPDRPIGWIGVVAAVIGLGATWVVLPLITTFFGETFPITDTVLMPIIGIVLTAVAAVLNVIALWPARQRNVLTLIATILTVMVTLVFGVFVIGEGLAGM
jgi:hypothetical protein